MSHLHWEPSLDTDIDIIDDQHRRIVDYINQLHDAIARKDRAAVGATLDRLIDYTITHFSFEERLMAQAGYAHLDAHKTIHDAFKNGVVAYKRRFDDGEDIAKQLRSGLCVWLIDHIKREDGAYTGVVKAHLARAAS